VNGNWSTVWALWLFSIGSAAAISFAVIEGTALATHRSDRTLTFRIREWLGIEPYRPGRKWTVITFSAVILGSALWFFLHIVFRWGY
jgi:hypothetical protein